MGYLEDIAAKKQAIATRATAKGDIDSLIKELKEIQLASLLADNNKSTVILASGTDFGEKLIELGDKVVNVLDEFKNDTTASEKLTKVANDFREWCASVAKSTADQASKVEESLNKIATAVDSVKTLALPVIPTPIVNVQERKIDFTPLQKTIREAMVRLDPASDSNELNLDDYKAQDIDNSEKDTQYIGFLNPAGDWYIIENKTRDNTLRYVFGKGDYSSAFAKAGSYQYAILSEAVNAL